MYEQIKYEFAHDLKNGRMEEYQIEDYLTMRGIPSYARSSVAKEIMEMYRKMRTRL